MSFQGKGFKICDKIMFPEEEEKKERRKENPLFMPCRWKLGSSALSIDILIMFWNKSWGIQSTLQMNCPPFKEETEIKDWQDEKKKQICKSSLHKWLTDYPSLSPSSSP